MGRKIVITSGKGGVGKTTVTAALGMELARLRQKVVLMDTDMGLNNLDLVLGLESRVVYDVIDVIKGRCRLKQALISTPEHPNLYILPSAHTYEDSTVTGQNLKIIADRLSSIFDFVLIDCPAGIEKGFHRACSIAEEALVVVMPTLTSVKDGARAIELLDSYNLVSRLIINRIRGDLVLTSDMMDEVEVKSLLKREVLGIIPDEDFFGASILESRLSKRMEESLEILAQNLLDDTFVMFDYRKKYRGAIGGIRRSLKRKI